MKFIIQGDGVLAHFNEEDMRNNKFIGDFFKHFFPGTPVFKEEPELTGPSKLPYAPTSADFDKVLSAVNGQDYYMLKVFELTGARCKEVFNLKWLDILFDQDLVHISSSKRTSEDKQLDYIPMDAELKETALGLEGEATREV